MDVTHLGSSLPVSIHACWTPFVGGCLRGHLFSLVRVCLHLWVVVFVHVRSCHWCGVVVGHWRLVVVGPHGRSHRCVDVVA